ncbi:MAG: hypothetical protein GQ541_00135, partial [Desulfovibrionaceae bacterium]|nr:hypothetical protein [Desulfovibrionaceae bacterium]
MARWFRRKQEDDATENVGENATKSPQEEESTPETGDPPAGNGIEPAAETASGIFTYMRSRLQKTRQTLAGQIDRLVLGKKEIDQDVLE